jgi:hypothetical protein
MQRGNDIKDYQPLHGPGFMIKFNIPEPADKELVKRIKKKISNDAKNRNQRP